MTEAEAMVEAENATASWRFREAEREDGSRWALVSAFVSVRRLRSVHAGAGRGNDEARERD